MDWVLWLWLRIIRWIRWLSLPCWAQPHWRIGVAGTLECFSLGASCRRNRWVLGSGAWCGGTILTTLRAQLAPLSPKGDTLDLSFWLLVIQATELAPAKGPDGAPHLNLQWAASKGIGVKSSGRKWLWSRGHFLPLSAWLCCPQVWDPLVQGWGTSGPWAV